MSDPIQSHKKRQAFQERTLSGPWFGAFVLALLVHFLLWWLPVELPLTPQTKTAHHSSGLCGCHSPKAPTPSPPNQRKHASSTSSPRAPFPLQAQKTTLSAKAPTPSAQTTSSPPDPTLTTPPNDPNASTPCRACQSPRSTAQTTYSPRLRGPSLGPKRPRLPRAKPTPRTPSPPVNLSPYRKQLSRKIQRNKRYPRLAHRMGFEGLVVLRIRISKAGSLLGRPKVLRSSGHKSLDREAIRMVMAAVPLPPMPSHYKRSSATFRLPVNFTLQ